MNLILTPELRAYLCAALVLLSLGSLALAAWVHLRWPLRRSPGFLTVYSLVLVGCVALALLLWHPARLFAVPAGTWPALAAVGWVAGWLTVWVDRLVVRAWGGPTGAPGPRPIQGRDPSVATAVIRPLVDVGRRSPKRLAFSPAWPQKPPGLVGLSVVAMLEELVHRGVLVELSRSAGPPVGVGLAWAGLVVAFALVHLHLGWVEVVAKLPLGIAAMGLALAFGTVLPAVVAHVHFNVATWVRARPSGPGAP